MRITWKTTEAYRAKIYLNINKTKRKGESYVYFVSFTLKNNLNKKETETQFVWLRAEKSYICSVPQKNRNHCMKTTLMWTYCAVYLSQKPDILYSELHLLQRGERLGFIKQIYSDYFGTVWHTYVTLTSNARDVTGAKFYSLSMSPCYRNLFSSSVFWIRIPTTP